MKLKLLALGAFVMCLTGCFDMTETFNIKEDGSGTYEMKMDMSRAFAMLAMMKQGAKEDSKMPEKLDSIIYYKSFVDTATNLTPEERIAFKDGYANIHMNEEEGEMYVNMHFPFKDGKQLSVIQNALNKTGNGSVMDAVGNALKSGMSAPKGTDPMAGGMPGAKGDKSGLPTSDFTYTLGTNTFSRKVAVATTAAPTKTKEDEMPEQFKEMMKINYTTVVNLPRPAKNVAGKATTSADKKQVKFTKSMSLDDKHTPADFDFNIDY